MIYQRQVVKINCSPRLLIFTFRSANFPDNMLLEPCPTGLIFRAQWSQEIAKWLERSAQLDVKCDIK